ncbi:MAG: type II toxin-antitoxin system prevent-host-death family antitoxin [Acidobacteriota bacterium]
MEPLLEPAPDLLTPPKSVGSRELKTRLGTYLRLVREGMTLIITDRGRPVAELRPLGERDDLLHQRLYDLAARGVIGSEVSQRRPLDHFEPIRSTGAPLSDAVLEDRDERI